MSSPAAEAFPDRLIPIVDSLSQLLLPPAEHACSRPFQILCAGETLLIPGRIYLSVPSESSFRSLRPAESSIVACWFTRHHDGHVRERFLRTLRAFDCDWIISYIVALCGEYVVEILRYIWEVRDRFDRLALGRFLSDNPLFYARTRSRIVSYWDCYYRSSSPRFGDYVGSHLLTFFDDFITNIDATGNA